MKTARLNYGLKRFFVSVAKIRNERGNGFRDSVWIFKCEKLQDIFDRGFTPNVIEIFLKKEDAINLASRFSEKHEYFEID